MTILHNSETSPLNYTVVVLVGFTEVGKYKSIVREVIDELAQAPVKLQQVQFEFL